MLVFLLTIQKLLHSGCNSSFVVDSSNRGNWTFNNPPYCSTTFSKFVDYIFLIVEHFVKLHYVGLETFTNIFDHL